MIMATQTPNTPMPSTDPSRYPDRIRKTHMDPTPMIIVYITSLAARNTLGSENEIGYITIAQILWNRMIFPARSPVASESP